MTQTESYMLAADPVIRQAANATARKFRLDWWWRDALHTVGQEAVWRAADRADPSKGTAANRAFAYTAARRAMISHMRRWFGQFVRGGEYEFPPPHEPLGTFDRAEQRHPADPEGSFRSLLGELGATAEDAVPLTRRFFYADEWAAVASAVGLAAKTSGVARVGAICKRLRGGLDC
jgi:DNA-directed RNA polymerase specialized sigma24 family protein